ncbi:tetratricopeptide repeat protein [Anaeromyxobacter dehalogenans 2CP-C]|uniref:Tetratricopeptide repeat protein n=2 Tax=Anaeromyxobacter dehalogenans TaxID=161493 RepID=Q2IKZ8_ANADE|nr:tetratricopeptide repeat protein [Anaeromyxobacter dehalogenans 2CP-C]
MEPHLDTSLPGPAGRRGRRLERRRGACALAAAAALALGAGCTRAARARFEGTRPASLLVEVLPRSAEVLLDDRPLGRGARTVPVDRADAGGHVLRFRAPGYVEEVREVPGGLAGVRVGAALQPEGWPYGPLDLDEPRGLAAAAEVLLGGGEAADAADYAARAVALEPSLAEAHRALGSARAAQGDRRGAAAAWGEYLRLRPDAPDAAQVAERLDALDGGDGAPGGN